MMKSNLNILVTGCAGFIGMHVTERLLNEGHKVIGIDNLNEYYDLNLKINRLKKLGIIQNEKDGDVFTSNNSSFSFQKMNVEDDGEILDLFKNHQFTIVIHLAAQAGVRYSITHPEVYIKSNINGFYSILEACKKYPVEHLIFASSSSIYGLNKEIPFDTEDKSDHPVSLYAATKKSNELMAHSYSHLFKIPMTGLRFFTVYGPWYRPDMAMYLFADAIYQNKPIRVFNYGNMERDFTYIDDITESIVRLIPLAPLFTKEDNLSNAATPYRILNIGNSQPVNLIEMIEILEVALDKKAIKELLPMQPGDVEKTFAEVEPLKSLIDFKPRTSLRDGIEKFASWYKQYHNLN